MEDVDEGMVERTPHGSILSTQFEDLGSADVQSFQHLKPLAPDRIRLVKFAGRPYSEDICCDIFEFDVSDGVAYDALSYAWEDPTPDRSVICNGQRLALHRSLHNALRRLCDEGYGGLLWTDFLCINQDDEQEKTNQVRNMAHIFRNAKKVLIWLGDQRAGDADGWEYLSHVRESMLETLNSGDAVLQQHTTLQSLGLPSNSNKTWGLTKGLFLRPWFTRLWILQEFVLAREFEIRCGSLKLHSHVIFDVIKMAQRHVDLRWTLMHWEALDLNTYACVCYLILMREEIKNQTQWDLQVLLNITCLFRCTDPRDRLFGLAGLTNQCLRFLDYSKDWTTVRIDMAKYWAGVDHDGRLRSARPLEFFCNILNAGPSSGLPSWVPDWRDVDYLEAVTGLGDAFRPRALPGASESVNGWCDESNRLHLVGLQYDQVKVVCKAPLPMDPTFQASGVSSASQQDQIQWHGIVADFLAASRALATGLASKDMYDDIEDSYWRTLIFDVTDWNTRLMPIADEEKSWFEAFRDRVSLLASCQGWPIGSCSLPDSWEEIIQRRPAWELIEDRGWHRPTVVSESATVGELVAPLERYSALFGRILFRMSRGRSFFVSKQGRMGWIPKNSIEGDQICVFNGDGRPYVIRYVDGGFKLIGACYMQGMMDGEPFDLPDVEEEMVKLL